jgi:hypothetical protein
MLALLDAKERENRNSLRSEVGKLLLKKLRKCISLRSDSVDQVPVLGEATGLKNILMCYKKYQTMIVHQHHIQIQGWPAEIPFNVPKIASSSDLRHIRLGLEQGSIRWVKLTREEVKELNAIYLQTRPETRKRSRGTKTNNKRPAKRVQQTGARKVKSAAYIEDDNESQAASESSGN